MKMIKITNNITEEVLYKQVEAVKWKITGKEIGAELWNICWDSINVECI